MQILHVYKDYYPIFGGIEGNLQQIAELQAAQGHDVTVLVTNPGKLPSQEAINGVEIIRAYRLATVASTPLSLTLPYHLRRQNPDIVHLHFPYPVGEVSQWLFNRRIPYVITYQSDVVKQKGILRVYRPILTHILRNAARIMVASPNYIRTSEFLRPLSDNCTLVPLGIDPTPYLSEQLTADHSPLTILFLGRHRHYKGGDVLIRAMASVANARLLVGGTGAESDKWKALTAQLGLEDRVIFLGDIPENQKAGLYKQADIFVLPAINRAEAFGIVLLEAMASGLPCVTTELGTGTSFVVQNEETGLVVRPNDPAALTIALDRLAQDSVLRQKMGANGRQRVLQEFTIERMVMRVEQVYREVLNKDLVPDDILT